MRAKKSTTHGAKRFTSTSSFPFSVSVTSVLPAAIAFTVASATSSLVMPRMWSICMRAFCSSMFFEKFVCVRPGLTTTTWMPSFASSARIASLNPATANLLDEYSDRAGSARRPTTDEMFTIAGVTPSLSSGRHARVVSMRPKKFVSKMVRSTCGSESMKCPVAPMPALLMSTSSPPNAARAAAAIASRSEGKVTSATTVSIVPPAARTSAASSSRSGRERAAARTLHPFLAATTHSARPIPWDAPVTSTRSPARFRRGIAPPSRFVPCSL